MRASVIITISRGVYTQYTDMMYFEVFDNTQLCRDGDNVLLINFSAMKFIYVNKLSLFICTPDLQFILYLEVLHRL